MRSFVRAVHSWSRSRSKSTLGKWQPGGRREKWKRTKCGRSMCGSRSHLCLWFGERCILSMRSWMVQVLRAYTGSTRNGALSVLFICSANCVLCAIYICTYIHISHAASECTLNDSCVMRIHVQCPCRFIPIRSFFIPIGATHSHTLPATKIHRRHLIVSSHKLKWNDASFGYKVSRKRNAPNQIFAATEWAWVGVRKHKSGWQKRLDDGFFCFRFLHFRTASTACIVNGVRWRRWLD